MRSLRPRTTKRFTSMSTYIQKALHPVKNKWMDALWLDDYFGPREYGIQFLGEKKFRRVEDIDLSQSTDMPADHTFSDFEFYKDAFDNEILKESGWEDGMEDYEIEEVEKITNSRYLLVELDATDNDGWSEWYETIEELAGDMEDHFSYIAYDYITHTWFVPVKGVTTKKIK